MIDTWAVEVGSAALVVGSLVVGGWRLLVTRRDYEYDLATAKARMEHIEQQLLGRDRIERLEAVASTAVQERTLDLILKPIRDEQEQHRQSMRSLGKTVARMDRKITAILVKMGIPVAEVTDGD